MKVLSILTLFILTSCVADKDSDTPMTADREFVFDCEDLGAYLWRCENIETICYKYASRDGSGLQCHFKQEVRIKDDVNTLKDLK